MRRFVCRQHLWQQVGKQARDTLLAKPGQKMITRLWLRCYKDREAFRQPRIELKYADIRENWFRTRENERRKVCYYARQA